MKRITMIGSLLSSPDKALKARGKRDLKKAFKEEGSLTGVAKSLNVSLRSVQRWAHQVGIVSPPGRRAQED